MGEVERQAVSGPQPLHNVSEGSLQGPENRESFNFWEVKGQVPSKVNSVATRRQARIVRPPSQAQPDGFFLVAQIIALQKALLLRVWAQLEALQALSW